MKRVTVKLVYRMILTLTGSRYKKTAERIGIKISRERMLSMLIGPDENIKKDSDYPDGHIKRIISYIPVLYGITEVG